jgi:hypothetical protein
MRVLTIVLIAALVGSAVGGVAGYVEVTSDPDATVALSGNGSPLPEPQGPMPRVEVVEPHYNFGQMERGRERSHQFVIRNTGDATLTLVAGPTSCKCTLSEVEDGKIAPGESTHARLEWSAKSDRGPLRVTATFHTNDPRQREIELTIDGEVVDASGVQPPDFGFDKLSVGETKSAEVYVMAMLQDELNVSSAELSDAQYRDKFDIKMEPVERDQLPLKNARDGVRITLTAKPGLPIGPFNQYLTLATNLKEGEKLHIPVIGRVVGDISVHGTRGQWLEEQGVLSLGAVESAQGKKARLNLVVRGEGAEDVTFEVGSVDPPELKVTFGNSTRLKPTLARVPMDVEVPPGMRPMVRLATAQGDEGKIVLKTTHPTMKELTLGVRFAVER